MDRFTRGRIGGRLIIWIPILCFALVGCAAPQGAAVGSPASSVAFEHASSPPTPPAPKMGPDWQIAPPYKVGDVALAGNGFDLDMRRPDFPGTYIECVFIDLTGPDRFVRIRWAGPNAADAPIGPWQSTIGRGADGFDCDKVEDSNTIDSLCTPKGVFPVSGFADHLRLSEACTYATWIVYAPRYIAMHSHHNLPREPASSGCIRLPLEAAKLIHNNSIVGKTLVSIDGKWERGK